MAEHPEIERFLKTMRAARIAGDAEATAELFHDDAVFGIVGLGEPVHGKAAIRAALASLIDAYAFIDWSPITVVVSGDEVATRHRLTLRHGPSGRVVETQTSEFLKMEDGRCRSLTQYVDTALAASLNAG